MPEKILIMGAAGRDFHVFNTCYRGRPEFRVVAFTAAQIPHIDQRRYPRELAGPGYPDGIPIVPESQLAAVIREQGVDETIFAYSDVSEAYVAERRALVERCGSRFSTFDVDATMLAADRPVIAIAAVRTGCGKSQTSRRVVAILHKLGKRTAVLRHPMPYGDLAAQAVQRFATPGDLDRADCTIEEREEYEPHIAAGAAVFAGVDYAAILARASGEADVLVWDGGNNDTPFLVPNLWITLLDPHRAGDELSYFPSRSNLERADIILVNKVDTADAAAVEAVEANARRINPGATLVRAASPVTVPDPAAIAGRRVLVIEDGPTVTHGGMKFGAGVVAARRHGAAAIVDPRPYAIGEIAETFQRYPRTGPLLPAMGYGGPQLRDLEATIAAVDCDLVLVATPIDLSRLIRIRQPSQRVSYELAEQGPALAEAIESMLGKA